MPKSETKSITVEFHRPRYAPIEQDALNNAPVLSLND